MSFEHLNLSAADTDGSIDAQLRDAAAHGRTGTVSYFCAPRGLAWIGLVVGGQLVGQVTMAAQSEDDAQLIAQSLAMVAKLTADASAAAGDAIANATRH